MTTSSNVRNYQDKMKRRPVLDARNQVAHDLMMQFYGHIAVNQEAIEAANAELQAARELDQRNHNALMQAREERKDRKGE